MVSKDVPRSEVQSVNKTILHYWQVMNIMKNVFNFWTVEGRIMGRTFMPAFPISISGPKNVSVGKKHNKYCISLISSWKLPPVEIFFDMNFSVNNHASYI
jgi:hypothetical protein